MNIFQEIFTTEGRLNRGKFFKYYILITLMGATATFVTSCMATFLTGDPNSTPVLMVTGAWALIAGAGNVMLIIRRLHDMGKSGWFALIVFVPVIGVIFSIAMFLIPGQVGWNEYGADPLTE